MNGIFQSRNIKKLRFNRTNVRIFPKINKFIPGFYGFVVVRSGRPGGLPLGPKIARFRPRCGRAPGYFHAPSQVSPSGVPSLLSELVPAGSPSPSLRRPAVFPPAAPRAPGPSPLSGVGLSAGSVNSMRGPLFGGQTPSPRPFGVPGICPRSRRRRSFAWRRSAG